MIDINKEKERIAEFTRIRKRNIDDFEFGDKVRFNFNGEKELEGRIEVKDYRGGGIYYGICPSVDIMGDDGVFYKHVAIVDVTLVMTTYLNADTDAKLVSDADVKEETNSDNKPIYLLTTGSDGIDDYDIKLGVFSDVQALKDAYFKVMERQEKDIKTYGFSSIETLKIYEFPKANELLDNIFMDIKVEPDRFGLPKVKDKMILPWN